ncbi:helix-turn-helix transcriptional regulator [Crenobacter cavernae]|uniref:DNA-binding protein n=1 Tax=Crenobacter cavernae TaxID=2290923 RepID=A0A345Y223_9NEIS|nr:helix-turn-helix domain-containing protein [Crenobacter cavernae]AXK37975.1 DNA-binding protein [Crenobacter cavernae]
MEQLLSPKMLAAYLGLAEQTIYNRHSTGGDLPQAIKLGHLLRFSLADVEAWLETKRQANTALLPAQVQPSTPRRRGRPTKAEQIAARRTC